MGAVRNKYSGEKNGEAVDDSKQFLTNPKILLSSKPNLKNFNHAGLSRYQLLIQLI